MGGDRCASIARPVSRRRCPMRLCRVRGRRSGFLSTAVCPVREPSRSGTAAGVRPLWAHSARPSGGHRVLYGMLGLADRPSPGSLAVPAPGNRCGLCQGSQVPGLDGAGPVHESLHGRGRSASGARCSGRPRPRPVDRGPTAVTGIQSGGAAGRGSGCRHGLARSLPPLPTQAGYAAHPTWSGRPKETDSEVVRSGRPCTGRCPRPIRRRRSTPGRRRGHHRGHGGGVRVGARSRGNPVCGRRRVRENGPRLLNRPRPVSGPCAGT